MALDLKIGSLRKLNQRELTLVVMAGIIGVVAMIYLFRGEGGIGFTGPQSRFTAEEARARVGSQLRVPEIDLALLDQESDAFINDRNLFTYGSSRRQNRGNSGTLPGQTPRGGGAGSPFGGAVTPPEETETATKAPVEEEPEPLPDPPEVTFKFVGFIGPPTDKTVFLEDEEAEEEYIGGVGESIAGQFRILEIGYEFVEIGYTDPLFEGQSTRIILAEWSEIDEESAE